MGKFYATSDKRTYADRIKRGQEKRFKEIKDHLEVERIQVSALFAELEEEMVQLRPGQLAGQTGIELAEKMDALLLTEGLLKKALDRLESVGAPYVRNKEGEKR